MHAQVIHDNHMIGSNGKLIKFLRIVDEPNNELYYTLTFGTISYSLSSPSNRWNIRRMNTPWLIGTHISNDNYSSITITY